MKLHQVLGLLLFPIVILNAQNNEPNYGPIIKNYGKSFKIENADLLLDVNTEYKVIFDVYTDDSKKGQTNPLINTVARFLNMHSQQGVLLENMKLVIVLHGEATKSALNNESYLKYFKNENPDADLISALKNASVEIVVCGQSFFAYNYTLKEKSADVKLALSALTALVEFQNKGYQIINFN